MSPRNIPFWLAMVVIGGVLLRAQSITSRPLWQDEAESVIYARQILDVGYPVDTFLGERLYETRSFLPDESSRKYEFQSTNFIGSRYEKNKGWLPYYLIAGSFKLFGDGRWQARIGAVAVSALTVVAVYGLARLAVTPQLSLLAAMLYAFNPLAIAFDRQARYYALLVLGAALASASFGRLRQTGHARWLWAATVSLVILFHTHLLAALFFGVAGVLAWGYAVGWSALLRQRRFWIALGGFTLTTLPWAALVNLPAAWQYAGSDPMRFRPLWLVAVASGALAVGGLKLAVSRLKLASFPVSAPVDGWIKFSVAYAVLMPLLTPAESVAERLFLPLLPLLTVVGVALAQRMVRSGRGAVAHGGALVIFILVVVGGLALLSANSRRRAVPYRTDWVTPLVATLEADGRLWNRLLVTDYNQFPLTVESGFPFQLLSVLRCSYLTAYPGPILYISRPVATPAGTVVALPFCNPNETACIQRTVDRHVCLQAGRDCATSAMAGTFVTDCTAPRTL